MALTNDNIQEIQSVVSMINTHANLLTSEGNAATQLMSSDNIDALNANLLQLQNYLTSILPTVAP
jgi:hypothetical protein